MFRRKPKGAHFANAKNKKPKYTTIVETNDAAEAAAEDVTAEELTASPTVEAAIDNASTEAAVDETLVGVASETEAATPEPVVVLPALDDEDGDVAPTVASVPDIEPAVDVLVAETSPNALDAETATDGFDAEPISDILVAEPAVDVLPVEPTSVISDVETIIPILDAESSDALENETSDASDADSGGVLDLPVIQATDDEKIERRRRRRRRSLIAVLVTLLVVGAVYLSGVFAFKHYFMPNTTLNGDDVSLLSAEEVATRIGAQADGYTLTVTGDNVDLKISTNDIDLRSDGDTFVQKAFDQVDVWQWPITVFSPHRLEVNEAASFDKKKLAALVEAAAKKQNEKAEKPVNAKAVYNKETHLYAIEPEKAGTAVDAKLVTTKVEQALEKLEPTLELGEEELLLPTVTSEDETLKKQVDTINGHLGATQKLKVGDNEVFEIGPDLIAGWVKVSDDLKVTIDKDAITKWAQGDLSQKLDSAGSERSYTRPDGKNVTVSGGDYGWTIDGATLAGTIADNIEKGTATTLDVPMLAEGASWNPGKQDWGKRYIDIDISEQHVRMYDDSGSLIWESDCVTGNSSEGHDTPQGVYQLNSNKTSGEVRLEGPTDPRTNEPEYVSYVTYWMPFIWDAVALHDATWRYSFGGDIYQYDGSHGCVNLPYDAAESLYDICQVGDVVVVHY